MEVMNLSQIQRQIDLQVGEQLGQIKQKLIEGLSNKVDWQFNKQVRQISEKIWQKTGMGNNYQEGVQERFDDEGYLINSEDWSIVVAEYLAKEEGVAMTDAHWEVVNFLREYYEEYKIAPMIKILVKAIGKRLGPDKGNTKYLYELYPDGPARQANKIAGLPRIGGCV